MRPAGNAMAHQQQSVDNRHSFSCSPSPHQRDTYHGSSGFSSSFSNPHHYNRNFRSEPPEYKSRRSDYISRPSYSSTDYIDSCEKIYRQEREYHGNSSKASRAEYILLSDESERNQLVPRSNCVASASAYMNPPDNMQGRSATQPQTSSFCQPIPSSRPVVEEPRATASSFSSPHEEHPRCQRSSSAISKSRYGRVRCHDSVQCNEEYDRSVGDYRRSHPRNPRTRSSRHDSIDAYESDCERYPAKTRHQLKLKDDDGYGSDYQLYSHNKQDSYHVDESDDGSDIEPMPRMTASSKRSARFNPPEPYRGGFSRSSTDDSSTLISSLEGSDMSSSTNTFCSPVPNTSKREYRRTMEEYGSDVEVTADDDDSDDGVSLTGSDFEVDGGAGSDSFSSSGDEEYGYYHR